MTPEEIKAYIQELQGASQFNVAKIPAHHHDGVDSLPVPFQNLEDKYMTIPFTLYGTSAAVATNYGVFFIAPFNCNVTAFSIAFQTTGTVDGTLQLEKLTGTQAPDAGTALLLTALSLTATANTVQYGTLVGTTSSSGVKDIAMNKGDRLCLKDINTLTTLANLTTTTVINF